MSFISTLDWVEVSAGIHPQEHTTREKTPKDANKVEERGEQGEADNRSGNPGADQEPERIDAHGIQGIDLLGNALDADLRGHS